MVCVCMSVCLCLSVCVHVLEGSFAPSSSQLQVNFFLFCSKSNEIDNLNILLFYITSGQLCLWDLHLKFCIFLDLITVSSCLLYV